MRAGMCRVCCGDFSPALSRPTVIAIEDEDKPVSYAQATLFTTTLFAVAKG